MAAGITAPRVSPRLVCFPKVPLCPIPLPFAFALKLVCWFSAVPRQENPSRRHRDSKSLPHKHCGMQFAGICGRENAEDVRLLTHTTHMQAHTQTHSCPNTHSHPPTHPRPHMQIYTTHKHMRACMHHSVLSSLMKNVGICVSLLVSFVPALCQLLNLRRYSFSSIHLCVVWVCVRLRHACANIGGPLHPLSPRVLRPEPAHHPTPPRFPHSHLPLLTNTSQAGGILLRVIHPFGDHPPLLPMWTMASVASPAFLLIANEVQIAFGPPCNLG